MKKEHLAESTIKVTGRRLRLIAKTVNLDDPEKVNEYLANKKGKKSYTENLALAYSCYSNDKHIIWERPKNKHSSQPPYVQIKEKITTL